MRDGSEWRIALGCVAPLLAACGPGVTSDLSGADARRIGIEFSVWGLGPRPSLHCTVTRGDDGTWTTTDCSACLVPPEDWRCEETPPESFDGVAVPPHVVQGLLQAMSGLQRIDSLVKCWRMTDNEPSYRVEVEFDQSAPAVVTIGGNCGPLFVTQGGVIGCDCTRALYDALWALFSAIVPDLRSHITWDHGPDEHCSCTEDFRF